jgi:hypothetical protein
MVVSNNKEWLTFFSGEGLVNREDILHIDSNFPVLEGLKTAKFGIHFLLPQELVRQKKREILNSFLKTLVVSFLSVGVGLGIFIYSLSYKNKIQDQIKVLKIQEQVNTAKLIELYQSRLLDLLSQNKHLAFDHLYFNFVKHIPANYILKNFDIIYKDNGLWSFEASIYPEDEYVAHQMFQQQGVFKQSNVVPIFLNNKLGQRITRDIDLKKEQI